MSLKTYQQKRDFKVSPEPSGNRTGANKKRKVLRYVIQKHRATQLHYDFRLEFNGVLLSWAVPKGPSLNPSVKRLAMQVEDHPVDYADFEGVIPEGEYGGGTVMLWDRGTWEPESEDIVKALAGGDLKFTLHGEKLKGSWVLVRTRSYGAKQAWLLIKHRDQFADDCDLAAEKSTSVASGRLLAQIAQENGGNVQKASTGDPAPTAKRSSKRTSGATKGNQTTRKRSTTK
jgi:bifunctional non-homologous end joining protein LigD